MYERILLMGPPGVGKSEQIINIANYINPKPMYVIDLEDKFDAMLQSREKPPTNIKLYKTFDWDEIADPKNTDFPHGGLKQISDTLLETVKPGDWIAIDRVDLSYTMVQDWFTKEKYKETMADLMMNKSKAMKGGSKFIPKFDMGSWQTIGEQYNEVFYTLVNKSRCNIVLTSGIKAREEDSPLDIGRLGVLPRGQKELGHQPHSLFLLYLKKEQASNKYSYRISTDKDLQNRKYFDDEELMDFSLQYLSQYYKG